MIFVDTSAWLALADASDRNHKSALAVSRRLGSGEHGKQVTTNYVMAETITLIRRRVGLSEALQLDEAIASGKAVQLMWIDSASHRAAVQLMSTSKDKDWSVTDCSSFIVMGALGIKNAFAYDADFSQAGFSVVR
jgi:uncharacterized protein